jgi:hypothetical protein
MNATVFYILGGQRLQLECEPHQRRKVVEDLRRQGLTVVGHALSGLGMDFREMYAGAGSGQTGRTGQTGRAGR